MVFTFAILVLGFLSVSADFLQLNKCYRFESLNFEDEYMRHRSWTLYKESDSGNLYVKDSTFKVIEAINGDPDQVSLESVNYAGYHIRHFRYWGIISKCDSDDSVCKNDGSWTVVNGLSQGSNQTVSFLSANFPGYYLRHSYGRVKISPEVNTTLYNEDSSWIPRKVKKC